MPVIFCKIRRLVRKIFGRDVETTLKDLQESAEGSRLVPIVTALAKTYLNIPFVWEYADESQGYNSDRIDYDRSELRITAYDDNS